MRKPDMGTVFDFTWALILLSKELSVILTIVNGNRRAEDVSFETLTTSLPEYYMWSICGSDGFFRL